MKRTLTFTTTVLALVLACAAAAAQPPAEDVRELRSQIEQRYDLVPLTDGLALRPKAAIRDVRLIEISDAGIAINGEPVTGSELRERLGDDADVVLRLSYLSAAQRRELLAQEPPAQPPAGEKQPEVERPLPEPEPRTEPERAERDEREESRQRTSRGDRVRIFGSVHVAENEQIRGQAVAVMGSVDVDGEVTDQVVAVMGSVDLGPNAVVGGDVVSVGGQVRRQPGAVVRGGITEVALDGPGLYLNPGPWFGMRAPWWWDGWGAVPRLIGSTFRFLLLLLLTALALVIARPSVERSAQRVADDPVKSTLVGVAAEILLAPLLFLVGLVLAISIVGIPLLLLLPFVVLLLILMALVGFSGTAYAIGQWARRRFGIASQSPFLEIGLGLLLVLLPLLLGRLVALVGWPLTPVAWLLIFAGIGVEFIAWSSGFGAVLTNTFSSWQARRASRTAAAPPPPPTP